MLSKENKIIYVTGDLNINLQTYNTPAKLLLDILSSFSILPTIKIPTRTTNTTETIIDNIFTNNLNNFSSGTIVSDISDHFPIFLSQSYSLKQNDRKKISPSSISLLRTY